MKKGILIGCVVLVLFFLIWIGVRRLNAPAEVDGSPDVVEAVETEETGAGETESDVPKVSVSGSEAEELSDASRDTEKTEDAAAEEETVETEDSIEEIAAADSSDEGVLYTIKTSAGSNLGMVPIVGGNAVVMMDGSNATTYQGDYMSEEQRTFHTKLEEATIQAASEGKINEWAFYRETMLHDFTFPEEVTAVEKFSFARSGLNSVSIPEGVTRIGYGAFYHCDALSDVSIPDSVTVIEENAFSHTPWLENWLAGGGEEDAFWQDDFLIVGDGILLAYRGNEEDPVLPETVKSVAPGALGE